MAAPPAYAQATDRPSLDYAPTEYLVGGKKTDPLLTVEQLRGHLALIHSACELRRRVEALAPSQDLASQLFYLPQDNERKWSWFLGLAVERFTLWCRSLEENDLEQHGMDVIPPSDVLLIFQTYLLNPGWFREDCHRIKECKWLFGVADFMSKSLGQMPEFLEASPKAEREKLWTKRCNVPFDPFDAAVVMASKPIECPCCATNIAVPYADETGTGYLQYRFSVSCPNCSMVIDKSILGMVKLAHDLVAMKSDSSTFLAGALWTPEKDLLDISRAELIRMKMENHIRLDTVQDILKKVKFKPERLIQLVTTGFDYIRLWSRMSSAYIDDRPFSVDLTSAALRQSSFNDKMFKLGWTHPGVFNGDEERVLVHCIARYHAFLDLLSTDSRGMGVPTLDIDLAWHTHQLMPTKYREDMQTLLKRSLDHDDTILESTLESAFDSTSRVWQKRFGTRYTHCGCPVPGDTIGSKLGKLLNSSSSSIGNTTRPFIAPEGGRDDMAALTHPSDHNAVYTLTHKKYCEALRTERSNKHSKRMEKEVKTFMKKKTSDAKDHDEEAIKRRLHEGHHPAFLTPIPMEEYEDPQAKCASFGGAVVMQRGGVIVSKLAFCSSSLKTRSLWF
ncbi:hypothetical protein DL96DRAFT_1595733 [Flagelloscypha sp. PMI_526]|nr:hypothetical protein DL96DRAFT_1595733 [Flagelloscypha sp. PMI_526]